MIILIKHVAFTTGAFAPGVVGSVGSQVVDLRQNGSGVDHTFAIVINMIIGNIADIYLSWHVVMQPNKLIPSQVRPVFISIVLLVVCVTVFVVISMRNKELRSMDAR